MKIILFLCFLIFHLPAFAQKYNPDELLNPNNPNYLKDHISQVYTGEPIIKMGGATKKDQRPRLSVSTTKELEQADTPLNLLYNIKTPFGIKETAGNTDHTTDFYTKIQVIDNQNLIIHENIQFVTTKPTKIERNIPLSFKNIKEIHPFEITVLGFENNKKSINYTIQQTDEYFQIKSTKEFPAGVHLINFKYILKNGIQLSNSLNRLFISVTGGKWPLPINRFRAIVLYPYNPISYQKELLFGNNNISINQVSQISTDINGNTIYTNTHPIPAFADIRILETFNGKNLPQSFNENFITKYFHLILSMSALLFLSIYLLFSNVYLRKSKKRGENVLKKINDLPPMVLMFLTNKKFSLATLTDFKRIEKTSKKSCLRTKIFRACYKFKFATHFFNFILKGCALFYIMQKYILTGLVIFLIILHPLLLKNPQNHLFIFGVITFIYLIELFLLYKKTIKPQYLQDISDFKSKILNPYLCYGLNSKTIISFYKRYYKTVYILDIHKDLKQVIEHQTKNIVLPTLNSKGK